MVERGQSAALAAEERGPIGTSASLRPLVETKRILVTVGAGGVGKTSLAASLGLLGARAGRRTLVLTIDPARRLAASLGLDELGQQEREVPAEKLAPLGIDGGHLYASMLDQKRTFDDVVRRHAPDAETAQRILANKLYLELSTRLAGGQEYAAMEKLYELVRSDAYDLLILDTPPTANAFDFLEAPAKMVGMMESPAVKLFVKSYETAGRLSFRLLSLSTRFVFKRLARFVGGDFLDDLAEFFSDMHSLLEGFRSRAAEVTELLRSDAVGFVVVTTPDRRSIEQARLFCARLAEEGHSLGGIVANRVHARVGARLDEGQLRADLAAQGLSADEGVVSLLLDNHQRLHALAAADERLLLALSSECQEGVPLVRVPLLQDDVYDVSRLARLSDYL